MIIQPRSGHLECHGSLRNVTPIGGARTTYSRNSHEVLSYSIRPLPCRSDLDCSHGSSIQSPSTDHPPRSSALDARIIAVIKPAFVPSSMENKSITPACRPRMMSDLATRGTVDSLYCLSSVHGRRNRHRVDSILIMDTIVGHARIPRSSSSSVRVAVDRRMWIIYSLLVQSM